MIARGTFEEIPFVIYIPDAFLKEQQLPLITLFRAWPDEWFNTREDSSRGRRSVFTVITDMIAKGFLKPAAFVFPATACLESQEYYFADSVYAPAFRKSQNPCLTRQIFEQGLLPYLKSQWPKLDIRRVALDGFSLGGATALTYAFANPARYLSVGSFDAVLMDYERDNRLMYPQTPSDVTFQDFPYVYGDNPDAEWFRSINPLDLIDHADLPVYLYMVASNDDSLQANAPRVIEFQKKMRRRGITNYAASPVLHPESAHEWYWVDEYLYRALPFHTHALNG